VPVVSLVTQVLVDEHDPAFADPTKPIGPYYRRDEARELAARRGWSVAEVAPGSWRRVVASPQPLRIIETAAVRTLVDSGAIPVACGGGGVPVVIGADGALRGVDAVIDKDRAASLLASSLGADTLAILMEADAVYEEFGAPSAKRVATLAPNEARELAQRMDPGGMRPKLEAAAAFADGGGTALICAADGLANALLGRAGTRIAIV
jgi:carbamate kinase